MNKIIKILSTLLIAILLVSMMGQVCFAGDYGSLINEVDTSGEGISEDVSGVKDLAGRIVKIIRNLAAILAVVILSIFGIKYMLGSLEERAEYKKSFIPLIIGVVVVLAAASIASLIFSVGTGA